MHWEGAEAAGARNVCEGSELLKRPMQGTLC